MIEMIEGQCADRRGGAAGSAGSADPPILDTVGQACVSDPPIFWMVVHFDGTL